MMPVSPPQGQPIPQGQQGSPPVTIDAVVKLLRDDRMRGFRIDIETDSLVEADQTQERQDRTAFVQAIGTFFKEFGPVVQQMPPLATMAGELLQFAVRGYKVGAELEECIEKSMAEVVQHLNNPAPPPPNPIEQAKLQIAQTKGQAEIAKANLAVQGEQSKAQSEQEKAQLEAFHSKLKNETEIQLAREKATMDKEAMLLDAELKARADTRQHELHQQKIAHAEQTHQHSLQQSDQAHRQTLEKGNLDLTASAESHKQKIEQTKTQGEVKEKKAKAAKSEPTPKEKNPVQDVVTILETLGKANKPKKVVRDKDGKITGIE